MGRDQAPLKPDCPHCGSPEVQRIGIFGGQLMTSQWQCKGCASYFEVLREDFDAHT
jgi:transposase-like protein